MSAAAYLYFCHKLNRFHADFHTHTHTHTHTCIPVRFISSLRLMFVSLIFLSCGALAKPNCETSQKIPSMGSVFELQVEHPCSRPLDKSLWLQVRNQLDEIENEITLYRTDSPLQRLNQKSLLEGDFAHLSTLLSKSITAEKKTLGAFNVTVLPVLTKIKDSFKLNSKPPSQEELQALRPLVDINAIKIQEHKILFDKKNVQVTLDGIGKGYAVDRVAEILLAQGLTQFLLNFSGNMKWSGRRADGKKWKIAVWNPVLHKVTIIQTQVSGAIASSGGENNHFSEDQQWHHIINPETLRPPNFWAQTTVVGESATDCDVLSTATFSLQAEAIRKMIKTNYPDYQVWSVDRQGKLIHIR